MGWEWVKLGEQRGVGEDTEENVGKVDKLSSVDNQGTYVRIWIRTKDLKRNGSDPELLPKGK